MTEATRLLRPWLEARAGDLVEDRVMAGLVAQQVLVDLQSRSPHQFASADDLGQWLSMGVLQTFALFTGTTGASAAATPGGEASAEPLLARVDRSSLVLGTAVVALALAGAVVGLLGAVGPAPALGVAVPSTAIVAPALGVPITVPTPTPSAAGPTPRPTVPAPFHAKTPGATATPAKKSAAPPASKAAVTAPGNSVVPAAAVSPKPTPSAQATPSPSPTAPASPNSTPSARPRPTAKFTPAPTRVAPFPAAGHGSPSHRSYTAAAAGGFSSERAAVSAPPASAPTNSSPTSHSQPCGTSVRRAPGPAQTNGVPWSQPGGRAHNSSRHPGP